MAKEKLIDIKAKSGYTDRAAYYREPWIYKVSDGVQIRYLNEPQVQSKEMQEQIKAEKIKLIEKFKNVAGGGRAS